MRGDNKKMKDNLFIQFRISGDHIAAFEKVKSDRYIESTTEMARSLFLSALVSAMAEIESREPRAVAATPGAQT